MIPALMLPMLLGAGLGAATSKKPLKGALLGAGLGAAGGALAPGLLGAGAASGAAGASASGAAAMGPVMGGEVAMGSAIPGLEAFATGYTPQGLLGAAGGAAKTAAPFAGLALQSGLLDGGQQQVQASPVAQPQVTATTLPELSAQLQQGLLAQRQEDQHRRQRRHGLLGGM